jgi:hypothetical protein
MRDKEGYPEAHLQIYGRSTALAEWSGKPRRELDRLHFPWAAVGTGQPWRT